MFLYSHSLVVCQASNTVCVLLKHATSAACTQCVDVFTFSNLVPVVVVVLRHSVYYFVVGVLFWYDLSAVSPISTTTTNGREIEAVH